MEFWDAYDADFRKIEEKTLVRGEPIPAGLFHLVCEVLVRHTDGTYLLMQRDPRKPFGGMWEATAAGSALAGETPLRCAKRELAEETGICSDALTELDTCVSEKYQTIYVEFLCISDVEKGTVTLQEGETAAFRWVSAEELRSMSEKELFTTRIQTFIDELKYKEREVGR